MARFFISYSRSDGKEISDELADRLRELGHEVFLDIHGIPGGAEWEKELIKRAKWCDVLLLLVSEGANQSKYVYYEFQEAEKNKKLIIPILISETYLPPYLSKYNALKFDGSNYDGLLLRIEKAIESRKPSNVAWKFIVPLLGILIISVVALVIILNKDKDTEEGSQTETATPTEQPPVVTQDSTPNNTPQIAVTPIVAGTILLEEDFEDNLYQGFVITRGTWQLEAEDSGNIVLASQNTDGFSNIDFGESFWKDYSVEYKVKIVESDTEFPPAMLFFRYSCNDGSDKCDSYIHSLSPHWKANELDITLDSEAWETLSQVEMDVETGTWYSIKVIVQGSNIQVFINDNLSLNVSDDQIEMGSLQLGVGPNTYAQFDDIKVVAWSEE